MAGFYSSKHSHNGNKSIGPDARMATKKAFEKEQRDKMINTYKDRLLPRFKVWNKLNQFLKYKFDQILLNQ